MSFTAPQRFLRGLSNHRRGDALGSFPNPMLDVFRWKLYYDDFNFGPAIHSSAVLNEEPSYGGSWHFSATGTVTNIGIAKGEPSCFQLLPGSSDDDAIATWPGAGFPGDDTSSSTSLTNSTTALDPDKDLIVATRFKTQLADDQDFAIGLGAAAEATIIDTTPNGLLVMGTDTQSDILVRIGDTDTKTITLSTARAAATFYDVVAYYRGKDRTLSCWLDNVFIDRIDADGAILLASKKGVFMGTQNGSATLAYLRVDYLMIAIER